MNLVWFLMILGLVLLIVYTSFMWRCDKKLFSGKIFVTLAIMTVLFAISYDGLIDKLFVLVFSIFLIFGKIALNLVNT